MAFLDCTGTERQLLHQEKEAFEVFRKEVLQDLQTQGAKLQVGFPKMIRLWKTFVCSPLLMQVEQEELRLCQHCKGSINLGITAQHTCQEVCLSTVYLMVLHPCQHGMC